MEASSYLAVVRMLDALEQEVQLIIAAGARHSALFALQLGQLGGSLGKGIDFGPAERNNIVCQQMSAVSKPGQVCLWATGNV